MKTKLLYLVLCAITLTAAAAIVLIPTVNDEPYSAPTAENDASSYIYTLGEYSGMVAVFTYGSDKPLEILECPLSSLPEEDAKQLLAGINIQSDEELQSLIEAYD